MAARTSARTPSFTRFPFDPSRALAAYHAALEARDFAQLATMFASGVTYRSAGLGEVKGAVMVMQALRDYFERHPDHHAWDEKIERVGPYEARSIWKLVANPQQSGRHTTRCGKENTKFDQDGRIIEILVEDQ
jgi:hypothetical protein